MNATDPMWIMVEGVDGAGKTTIVQKCAIILARAESSPGGVDRRPVVVQCLSFNTPEDDYLAVPDDILRYGGCHVLQDRGVISGPVYEPIMRGDQERLSWMLPLVPAAVKHGAVVLFVDASLEALKKRIQERGDDYVDVSHLEALQQAYYHEIHEWKAIGGKCFTIDTTDSFPDELELELVLSLLK